jgi:hypothetical protein
METNLPQLSITIDTLTNTLLVEEHYRVTDNLQAGLADPLGLAKETACAAPAEILAPPIAAPGDIAAGPCIRISGRWHNSLIEGPGRRSTVKLQGCSIHCVGLIDSMSGPSRRLSCVTYALSGALFDALVVAAENSSCDSTFSHAGQRRADPERRGARHQCS